MAVWGLVIKESAIYTHENLIRVRLESTGHISSLFVSARDYSGTCATAKRLRSKN